MTNLSIQEQYRTIWDVLSSLTEQDAELSDTIKLLSIESGYSNWEQKYDTASYLKVLSSNESIEKIISIKILKIMSAPWEIMFGQLLAFKEEHEHTRLSEKSKTHKSLGKWLRRQRLLFSKGCLPEYRKKLMEASGITLTPPNYRADEEWQKRLKKHVKYMKDGSKFAPQHRATIAWAANQRKAFKEGRLAAKRIKELEKVNFEFESLKTTPQLNAAHELVAFIKKHGHSQIPAIPRRNWKQPELDSQSAYLRQLYLWRQKIVTQYRKGKLNKEVVKILTDANFAWEM